jgi:small multidrug resistance pump
MQNTQFLGIMWCALASLASAAATYLIKMSGSAGEGFSLARLAWLGAACGAYGMGFVAYAFALQRLQISLAYPVMTAITIAMVALIGYFALQEPLGMTRLAGIALVTAGAFLVAR